MGFKTETLKCISGMEDSMDNIPLPCVAHIVIDEDLLHYVVILKVEKNKIIISVTRSYIFSLTTASISSKNLIVIWKSMSFLRL